MHAVTCLPGQCSFSAPCPNVFGVVRVWGRTTLSQYPNQGNRLPIGCAPAQRDERRAPDRGGCAAERCAGAAAGTGRARARTDVPSAVRPRPPRPRPPAARLPAQRGRQRGASHGGVGLPGAMDASSPCCPLNGSTVQHKWWVCVFTWPDLSPQAASPGAGIAPSLASSTHFPHDHSRE